MIDPTVHASATVEQLAQTGHVEERLKAHLAEYEALRKEIEWLGAGANQYFTLGLLLIGATATVMPFVLDKATQLIIPTLLTLPLFFSLLGFLYFRDHEEIFVIAAYLREYVRPAIRELLGDNRLWGWEEFKYERFNRVLGRGVGRLLNPVRIANVMRSMIFLLPSVIAMVAVYGYGGVSGFPFNSMHNATLDGLLQAWYVVDIALTVFFLLKLLTQGNFAKRILNL